MTPKELYHRVKHYTQMAADFREFGFIEDANDLEKHVNAIMGPVERVGLANSNGKLTKWRNKTKRTRRRATTKERDPN